MRMIDIKEKFKREFISFEFLKFVAIGVFTAIVNFLMRFFFRLFLSYVVSVAMAATFAGGINFILNKTITFNSFNERVNIQILKFIVASIGGILLTTLLAYIMLKILVFFHLPYFNLNQMESISHIIAICLASTLYGFLVTKYFVFRKFRFGKA